MFPVTDFGQFKASWRNTFVGAYEAVGSNFTLDFKRGNFDASWTLRHISELREECGRAVGFPVCSNPATGINVLEATTYNDMQLGYRFEQFNDLRVAVGVNNVFDNDPPICLSCSLNGYDASTYDIPGGRFWYLRADIKF